MITRSNYEQYFLDFHEAALGASVEKELFAFLDKNPDLREEFESFIDFKLEPDLSVSYPGKSSLHKKFVHNKNYISRLVAYLENDLDENERLSVEEFVKNNSGAAEELEILKKTKIQPDYSIVFSDKSSLKREAKVIGIGTTFYRVTAVAAALIILLTSFFVFFNSRQEPAFTEEKPIEKVLVPRDVISPSQEKVFIANSSGSKEKMPVTRAEPSLDMSTKHKSKKKQDQKESAPSQEKVNPTKPELILEPSESTLAQIDGTRPIKNEVPDVLVPVDVNNKVEATNKVSTQVPLGDLSTVFSQEELAEFGLVPASAERSKTMSAWDIAETGVARVAKAAGVNVELDRHSNHINNATTYALAIGRFSVSHTSVR